MSDVIQLLPNHIANQIAAGEVVQRPASVVKELMENAIDAGASSVQLIVKEGGKTLVQLVDNGCGMSDTDARLSFERHATSKIREADDLFALQTKGFRGEALASIAAVAHVTMKTKLHGLELGTAIVNEGSELVSQEAVACQSGTSIAVKNLFYNVPARRNFLGSNRVEHRKVMDEFLRIALLHHELAFSFHDGNREIFHLLPSNRRQRIVALFGKNMNERLIPVDVATEVVTIQGFVTKPAYARSKADQTFLFVNHRFFKDRYFHHAIQSAYEEVIRQGKYPAYFIYFEVPPHTIDVNVHPTKTEIKFEENKVIYTFLKSGVKQALGQFSIAPSLDFEQENNFDVPPLKEGTPVTAPTIAVDPDYNPFKTTPPPTTVPREGGGARGTFHGHSHKKKTSEEDWQRFYGTLPVGEQTAEQEVQAASHQEQQWGEQQGQQQGPSVDNRGGDAPAAPSIDTLPFKKKSPIQLHDKYILAPLKNGLMLIDQYRAHVRILFDRLADAASTHDVQRLLFEEKMDIDPLDVPLWEELLDDLNAMGFTLTLKDAVLSITGQPAAAKGHNPLQLIRHIVDDYQKYSAQETVSIKQRVALSVASGMAVKAGTPLQTEEMEYLVDALFASSSPQYSPHGKKIITVISTEEITKRLS